MNDPESPVNVFDIVGSGALVLGLLVAALFLIIKFLRKSADRSVDAYRPLAEPLYTGVSGRPRVYPGWYPTANGDQDRFHDGRDWTTHYRPHTKDSKLGDAGPAGVAVYEPEPPMVNDEASVPTPEVSDPTPNVTMADDDAVEVKPTFLNPDGTERKVADLTLADELAAAGEAYPHAADESPDTDRPAPNLDTNGASGGNG